MSPSSPSEARRVYFSGHVQGVGFRYTARSVAERYAVTGFVRNLSDGRVELFAEGPRDELNSLLAEIGERMGDYIRKTQIQSETPRGQHQSFEIVTDQ